MERADARAVLAARRSGATSSANRRLAVTVVQGLASGERMDYAHTEGRRTRRRGGPAGDRGAQRDSSRRRARRQADPALAADRDLGVRAVRSQSRSGRAAAARPGRLVACHRRASLRLLLAPDAQATSQVARDRRQRSNSWSARRAALRPKRVRGGAARRFAAVRLGPRILRTETAAVGRAGGAEYAVGRLAMTPLAAVGRHAGEIDAADAIEERNGLYRTHAERARSSSTFARVACVGCGAMHVSCCRRPARRAQRGRPPDSDASRFAQPFVVLGEGGVRVARVITVASTCPAVDVDGASLPMSVRALPATEPLRPTLSAPRIVEAVGVSRC